MKPLPIQSIASKIIVTTVGGRYYFSPEDIIRLEASSNYTRIYFTNRTKIVSAKLLKDFEQVLAPHGFVRTHRSHIVNKRYVSHLDEKGNILMHDESRAEVSRRKKSEVLRAFLAA